MNILLNTPGDPFWQMLELVIRLAAPVLNDSDLDEWPHSSLVYAPQRDVLEGTGYEGCER